MNADRRAEIGQQRREKTRQRLVAAAARVIARRGESNATIDDFIQVAGVARGTFYNYFQTREEVLEALWRYVGKSPYWEIHRTCADIADPAERLATFSRQVLCRTASDPTWGWLVYYLSADRDTVNVDLLSFPLPDLLAGCSAGRFILSDVQCARDLVVGAIRSGMNALLNGRGNPSYGDVIAEMILRALGIDGAEAKKIASFKLEEIGEIAQSSE
jgi:AcrR family transcriptional regulator